MHCLWKLILSLLSPPLTKPVGADEAKKLASPAPTGPVRGDKREIKNSYK
jgi:hypothetical protein